MRPFVAVFLVASSLAGVACQRQPTPAAAPPPPAAADTALAPRPGPPLTACPDANPLKNVYFGDLHVHTAYSLDSFATGNRNDPGDAYRFARGATLEVANADAHPGPKAHLDRPLDFLAVTDHSEFFDVMGLCLGASKDAPYCKGLLDQGSSVQKVETLVALFRLSRKEPESPILCRGTQGRRDRCASEARATWQRVQDYAEAAYERCRFTTFKGYEWTGQSGQANLHRNVIFGTSHVPPTVADYIHHPKAIDLWQALARDCRSEDGCDALTIPHNSNASFGQMWDTAEDPAAVPFMRRYQTLTEIFQHKASSECLPGDPLSDPGCDFEVLRGSFLDAATKGTSPAGPAGYVRAGLARGLSLAAKHGQNPLRMGIIGSTDTHNSTGGNTAEASWPGHAGVLDNAPAQRLAAPYFNPGGLAAVWAEENTREALFAALKRRETYATSGTRLRVRFYLVPELADAAAAEKLCADPDFPKALLARGGVPMGGLFKAAGKPHLFVLAEKDQTDLLRVDFIKVASDVAGATSAATHELPLLTTAAKRACVHWQDPDFDPARPTLYYARIVEQPTWRWSHYDCTALGAKRPPECDKGLDVKIQERAWTSPIFSRLASD